MLKNLLRLCLVSLGINDVLVQSKVWNEVIHWVGSFLLNNASSTGADWITLHEASVIDDLGLVSLHALVRGASWDGVDLHEWSSGGVLLALV